MRPEEMTREQLLEIVRRLPTTADGVPIVPGMELWAQGGWPRGKAGYEVTTTSGANPQLHKLYSSHEAGAAAKSGVSAPPVV